MRHCARNMSGEPGPPEPLDDQQHLRPSCVDSVGFTRRRLGPRREPVVHRMRQLTGDALQGPDRRSSCRTLRFMGTAELGDAGDCRRLMGHLRPRISRGSESGCTTSRPACTTSHRAVPMASAPPVDCSSRDDCSTPTQCTAPERGTREEAVAMTFGKAGGLQRSTATSSSSSSELAPTRKSKPSRRSQISAAAEVWPTCSST